MDFALRKGFESDLKKIKPYADKFNLDSEGMEANKLYIAERNGNLAGFGRYKNYRNIYEISTVGILENFRGQSAGKIIVNKLIDSAFLEEIWLTTVIPDYFKKFGFEINNNIPRELGLKTLRICAKFNKQPKLNVFMKLRHP